MRPTLQVLLVVCVFGSGLGRCALAKQDVKPGLAGTYFAGDHFTRPEDGTDILNSLDNDWGSDRGYEWSARWAGYIKPPVSGEVTFTAEAVDGIRLLIDGKVIIAGLDQKNARSGKAVLEGLKKTPIVLEFASRSGNARLHVYWQWEGQARTIVPADVLWHVPTKAAREETAIKEMIKNTRALREKLLRDPYRPGYHFIALEGICAPFDINAAIFWKGKYHIFYIFQNEKGHCWGHASSIDLVHWRHHPTAFEPGEGDRGIFSGGAFVDKNGVPTITYWGLDRGVCIATSSDDELNVWTKSPHNPVIRETHHGYAVVEGDDGEKLVYGVADPTAIWINEGRYYMLTGNLLILQKIGRKQNRPEYMGDTAYLFVSDDLINWKYLHKFYESDRKWTQLDEDNMCPDFFALPAAADGGPASDRHMLLFISHNRGCQYYLGRYAEDRFIPETHGRMSWVDNAFFAPESILEGQGRRMMWAWIREMRKTTGWSGTLSLPRVLYLGEDKTLRISPPKELEMLRYNPKVLENFTVTADAELPLTDIRGNSIELSIEMIPGSASQCGVKVCASPDGQEQTLVFYDAAEKMLKIDPSRSSLGESPKSVEAGPLELRSGEPLKLRVFVDKSVVEVFANDRQAVMRRIYPTRQDSVGVVLFSKGGPAGVTGLQAWDMMAANPY
ncbi:MAG: GH32 C-terminal domain-containing protein [Planctomycetota bacterium]|jgi:beta-fructofuranosidase